MTAKPLKILLNTTLVVASLPHIPHTLARAGYPLLSKAIYQDLFFTTLLLLCGILPGLTLCCGLNMSCSASKPRFLGHVMLLIGLQATLFAAQIWLLGGNIKWE